VRAIVVLLLVANVCLVAYAQLGALGNAPNPGLAAFKPEKIQLLTAQQVAALGPSKVAQLNLSCAEWGPFTEKERPGVQQLLDAMALGKTLSVARAEIPSSYWLHIPAKPTRGAMERALKELKGLDIGEASAVTESGPNQYAISFGQFRSEVLAQKRLNELEARGLKTAKITSRDEPFPGVMFVIREPAQATVAALEEAKAKAPAANLAFASCRDRPT
jgi:hypothetical protein